jgi:hypothetical protein
LLQCPVSDDANVAATVLGVGKFLMTVPASSERLVAEFGGAVPPRTLKGRIELFP